MANEWIKGNKPYNQGLYWVTTDIPGNGITVYEQPMMYTGEWYLINGGKFYSDNIVAHMEINKPRPYNLKRIGISGEYYLKVTKDKGTINYYAKQLTPINWSIVGYSSQEKAVVALKRLRKLDKEELTGNVDGWIYEVVTDDGDVVFELKAKEKRI